MPRQLFTSVLACSVVLFTQLSANGDQAGDGRSVFEGRPYQLQQFEEPAPLLIPVKPRTVDMEGQLNSAAWFMAGRLYEQREKFNEAYAAYQKAAKAGSGNISVYRSLINVALRLGKDDEAVNFAMDAVKLDPDDFQLLRQLGVEMVKDRKLPEAIKFLEQARQSPKLNKKSGFYVLINRDLGIIYSGLGDNEKAADAYEIVLKALIDPAKFGLDRRTRDELQKHRSTSFEKIGQVLLRANRNDVALTALEKAAAKRNGQSGGVNYLLAQLYFQKEDFENSLKQLNLFFGSKLNRGRGPYVLFEQVLTKLEKQDSLASRLENLTKKDPTNKDLKLALAGAYVKADRLDDAEAIFKTSIEDGATGEAFMGLAQIYRRQKKAAELLENMAKVFAQEWRRQTLQAQRGQAVAPMPEPLATELKVLQEDEILLDEVLKVLRNQTKDGAHAEHFGKVIMLAEVSSEAKRIDDAAEMYRLAIDANPAESRVVFSALGSLLMSVDRFAEAAAVYRDATTKPLLQGSKPDFLLRLAMALELAGETDPALEAIADANKLIPNGHYLLAFREAWINYHAHRFETAAKLFEAFIEKYPNQDPLTKQAKFSLSAVYVQLNDFQRGEEILEKYYAENPDDIGVNNDLGYLYADQGKNLEKARKMIEKAVEAEPENAAYLDSLGWVLFKLGETKEAITWLEKATKQENGNDATIWEHLGDCHNAEKDAEEARKAWKKALELTAEETNPDKDLVKRLQEKLSIKDSDVGKVQPESKDDP